MVFKLLTDYATEAIKKEKNESLKLSKSRVNIIFRPISLQKNS